MDTVIIRPTSAEWFRLDRHLIRLAQYSDLLYTLSAHRLSVRYKQTWLGLAWAALGPLLTMLLFTAVFSVLTRVPSDGLPYALFAFTGLLPWTFFNGVVANASGSLLSHTHLITKVFFPREILPLTYVVAALCDLAIAFLIFLGLLAWYDVPLTARAWLVLPLSVLLSGWALTVSLVLAIVHVRFRDIGLALPLLLQFLMFASPVIYPLSAVPDAWRPWYLLNPLAGIMSGFRDVLLHGRTPEGPPLALAAGVTLVLLPAAYLFFKRAEATLADRL